VFHVRQTALPFSMQQSATQMCMCSMRVLCAPELATTAAAQHGGSCCMQTLHSLTNHAFRFEAYLTNVRAYDPPVVWVQ
jgi:hypothetical protein